MENRQATIVDHKLESRPQEGGKRKVIFNKNYGREISVKICTWKNAGATEERRRRGECDEGGGHRGVQGQGGH